ncbi:hypothetical protein N657DRAFT_679075 [Parathielavia appendiculata]|uniref:Uncharacterized protein n=1 Tax=Parathielavia appendiculata TaxID=2587402 RepID=A0AAN6Z6J8_9PEZI|nr:hypothetical protein N657DRAFT_679075 [Parathielavia appendiculata]
MAENRKQSIVSTDSAASPTAQQFPTPGQGVADPRADTATAPKSPIGPTSPTIRDERRASDEWDASKVPPSRFQKRKGSIYAVPGSRDGRVDHDTSLKFHEKLVKMGIVKK